MTHFYTSHNSSISSARSLCAFASVPWARSERALLKDSTSTARRSARRERPAHKPVSCPSTSGRRNRTRAWCWRRDQTPGTAAGRRPGLVGRERRGGRQRRAGRAVDEHQSLSEESTPDQPHWVRLSPRYSAIPLFNSCRKPLVHRLDRQFAEDNPANKQLIPDKLGTVPVQVPLTCENQWLSRWTIRFAVRRCWRYGRRLSFVWLDQR